jgi:5'-nucleotidase / UDP-sugar diphosphatase
LSRSHDRGQQKEQDCNRAKHPDFLPGVGYTLDMKFGISLGLLALTCGAFAQKPLTLTVLHTNDLHAHVEPTPIRGKAYGGYARHATIIKQTKAKEKNVLVLNAGDVFQGTLYFNVYDGLADLALLNSIGYQAQTLGNHEFDKGIPALIEYATRANFPLLACNIDFKSHDELKPWIKPYTILEVDKQKVGIIGLITDTTPSITTLGDELGFLDHISSTQKAVDDLTAQGVNKIILMSHIGYEDDKILAAKVKGVDAIIGGHSHTPLGTPALEGWRPSGGPFPTLVKDLEGNITPIFQAWEWGKVMGKFKLKFDRKGKLEKVEEAVPMVVGPEIAEDPAIASMVDAFRKPLEALMNTQVAMSEVALTDRTKVGYLVADSYLDATAKLGADLALMNPGGVRANLEAGKVSYAAANAICPFRNTLTVADLTGAELVKVLSEGGGGLIPSANVRYQVAGGGAREVKLNGVLIDPAKTYRVTVNNFMAGGGDNLVSLKTAKKLDTGLIDIDAFIEFLKKASPIKADNSIRVSR